MLYLGADHNGFELKEKIRTYLSSRRLAFVDCGAKENRPTDDYVDFAVKVGRSLRPDDLGILVCGSGHGMTIAANKLPGIRAVLPMNAKSAGDARRDDHANVLVLAAWETKLPAAQKILDAFLAGHPSAVARHLRRLSKIKNLER